MKAVAQLTGEDIQGSVTFLQKGDRLTISVSATLPQTFNGFHGFHIHEFGDRTNGCESMGAHFDRGGNTHGGRYDDKRHAGDLGNLTCRSGVIKETFYLSVSKHRLSLRYESPNCVLGRGIVLHSSKDDCGKGDNEESLITGNSGARIACGVIALARGGYT